MQIRFEAFRMIQFIIITMITAAMLYNPSLAATQRELNQWIEQALITDNPDTRQRLHHHIWQALSHTKFSVLREYSFKSNSFYQQGWIELALYFHQQGSLENALAAGRSRWGSHPAWQHPPVANKAAPLEQSIKNYRLYPSLTFQLREQGNESITLAALQSCWFSLAPSSRIPILFSTPQHPVHQTNSLLINPASKVYDIDPYLTDQENTVDQLDRSIYWPEIPLLVEKMLEQREHQIAIVSDSTDLVQIEQLSALYEQQGGTILGIEIFTKPEEMGDKVSKLNGTLASKRRWQSLAAILKTNVHFEPRPRQDLQAIFISTSAAQAGLIKALFQASSSEPLSFYASNRVYSDHPTSKDLNLKGVHTQPPKWKTPPSQLTPRIQQLSYVEQRAADQTMRLCEELITGQPAN